MNAFNEQELIDICKKLNSTPEVLEITLNYKQEKYFNKVKHAVATDRRGEVVFGVKRPNGKIIAVTCLEYPPGIFRVPTGGIGHKEDVIEAVFREAKEELGLTTSIEKFGAVIKFKIFFKNDWFMFYSYVFILNETGGVLLKDATDDEVSEIKELDIVGLEQLVEDLGNLSEDWSDWGKFRQSSSSAILKILKNE